MRRLKSVSLLFFAIALILFGVNYFKKKVIEDQTGPVFHMESKTVEVSVKDDEQALLEGLTAEDAKDGDITSSIIVENISPFTGTGNRIVTYAAFDSDNHVTHEKRELKYIDYEPSHFHLSKPLFFAMNATNLLDGITVEDCIDGDLTKNIRMMSDEDIDTAHVGEYRARLKVTNSAGGVSYLPVTIEIYDASVRYKQPSIKLSDNVVYLERGADFDEDEYLESITVDGTEYSLTYEGASYGASALAKNLIEDSIDYSDVNIESNVDTAETGYYEVVYTFDDYEYGTGTGKTRLYVVVTEGRAGEE